MIPVVYGAGFALVVALVWMAVPWRILPGRRHATAMATSPSAGETITDGQGFHVATYHGTQVTSVRHYANGSTQVWLKRNAA